MSTKAVFNKLINVEGVKKVRNQLIPNKLILAVVLLSEV